MTEKPFQAAKRQIVRMKAIFVYAVLHVPFAGYGGLYTIPHLIGPGEHGFGAGYFHSGGCDEGSCSHLLWRSGCPFHCCVFLLMTQRNSGIRHREQWTSVQSLEHPPISLQIVATLAAFILAILLHPEVQTSAQQELDKVLGEGDLPTFNDEPSLPYITALVKEVLRYSPAIPLGKT